MIQITRHVHMVALILACTADVGLSISRAYKVKDSNEEADHDYTAIDALSFADEGHSDGFYGGGFHFPDFFNDGHQDGNGFGLVSPFVGPFPVLSESRHSDTTYVVPANTFSTGKGSDRRKAQVPHSRSAPRNYETRSSKKPITKLYDDWKPGDEQPRSSKWSPEHDDDDSAEAGPVKPYPSNPYKDHGGRPYSEASVRQHYKTLRPVGKTRGTKYASGEGDFLVHQHKYGVSHVYDPKKASEEHSDERDDEKLQDRKPQQFKSNPHFRYRNSGPPPPPPGPAYYGSTAPRGKNSFKPSPPDYYRNSRTDFDFFSDSSKVAPTKVKSPDNHEQLDESCVKSNKTTTINMSDGKINLNCYDCYDKNRKPYEQCIEVSKPNESNDSSHKRYKRQVNNSSEQSTPVSREKRQYDEYYDGEGESYGPDSSDYRFGPEHFNDDYPSSSYDDGAGEDVGHDYDSERCTKARKGEMLCITCENRVSGGKYKQCSYASDPRKNSYERSVSKVYGSPRLPEENRRKQVDGPPRRAPPSKRRPHSSPPPSGPDSSGYESDPGYSRPRTGGRKGPRSHQPREYDGPRSHQSRVYDGPSPKYRGGSQGRSPLPARGSPRSAGRTPASTQLRTSPRSLVRPGALSSSEFSDSYLPARHPPPSSRAYSTPSPIGPNPFAYDLPDPYSPDPVSLTDGGAKHGTRNRKNIDPSFDPGYDETFASLFPELVGDGEDDGVDSVDAVDSVDSVDPSSAVALAPPSYDEYPDGGDYDEGPERRRDVHSQHNQHTARSDQPIKSEIPHSTIIHPPPSKYGSSFQRDKSSCKKVKKNKMTCYQCIDDKGTKHEECIYVAESEPKSKHTTYREVKELKYDPYNGNQPNTHSRPHTSPPDSNRGKRKFKKYEPEEQNKQNFHKEASGNSWESKPESQRRQSNTRDRYNATVDQMDKRRNPSQGDSSNDREKREPVEDLTKKTDSEIEKSTRKNYNPIPTDPPEFDKIGENYNEDGEFSADLELKYDPVLGLSLPKYMVEKSQHEAIFDEVLGSGTT